MTIESNGDEQLATEFINAISNRDKIMKSRAGALAQLVGLSLALGIDPSACLPKDKPMKKCSLPGCGIQTIRDYCCVEHYREAKKRTAPGAGK